TIKPKPPLCSSMSVVLNACSIGLSLDLFFPQRTQSSREKLNPTARAETGSKESLESTSAQKCFCVACASRDIRTEVLPEDARLLPQISVRALTGMPAVTLSI